MEKDAELIQSKAAFTKISDQEYKLTVLCRTREQTFCGDERSVAQRNYP